MNEIDKLKCVRDIVYNNHSKRIYELEEAVKVLLKKEVLINE